MNLKKVVMDLRVSHNLKGKYPLVVFTIPNSGGVYSKSRNYYVMTFREKENDLYFHHIKGLFNKYDPKGDFSIRIDKFKSFTLELLRIGGSKFTLISYKGDYFPIGFFRGLKDSYEGENNLQYIIDELIKRNINFSDKSEEVVKKESLENGKQTK